MGRMGLRHITTGGHDDVQAASLRDTPNTFDVSSEADRAGVDDRRPTGVTKGLKLTQRDILVLEYEVVTTDHRVASQLADTLNRNRTLGDLELPWIGRFGHPD